MAAFNTACVLITAVTCRCVVALVQLDKVLDPANFWVVSPIAAYCKYDFFRWCTVDLSTLSLGLPYAATIYGSEATHTIRRYPSIELYSHILVQNENCLVLLTETAYRRK